MPESHTLFGSAHALDLSDEDLDPLQVENDILSILNLESESLASIPGTEQFKRSYTKKLKNSFHPQEKTYVDISPNKGRIMRSKCNIACGEIIFLEHPIIRISEYQDETKLTLPEVWPEKFDFIPTQINYETPPEDVPVLCYHPMIACDAYPDLTSTEADSDLASERNANSDFVTLARIFETLPACVRERLADLYAPNPFSYSCDTCKEVAACEMCHAMNELVQTDVRPLLAVLQEFGITDGKLVQEIILAALAIGVNCFDTGNDSVAVFSSLCMCSHSCMPNAIWEWSHLTRRMKLTACRPIRPGEEITVSYLSDEDIVCPRVVRRLALRETHLFTCMCPRCSAEDPRSAPALKALQAASSLPGADPRSTEDASALPEFEQLAEDLKESPWISPIVDSVSAGAPRLVGPALVCTSCGHQWFDLFAPVVKSERRLTILPNLGIRCPKCDAVLRKDRLRRNELVTMWLACLEEPNVFVNPPRSLENTDSIVDRLHEIVLFISKTRSGGFLASAFLDLLAIVLFNTQHQPVRGAYLLALSLSLLRDKLYGRWFDFWLSSSHFVPLCNMAYALGMQRLSGLLARKIWTIHATIGTETGEELKYCQAFPPPGTRAPAPTVIEINHPPPNPPAAAQPDAADAASASGSSSEYYYEEEEEETTPPRKVQVNPLYPMGCFSERLTPISDVCTYLKRFHWLRNGLPYG